jgi:putative glutamine amidotransferase
MRPLIALTGVPIVAGGVLGWRQGAVACTTAYLEAIQRAGADPVIVPPVPVDQAEAEARLGRFDGLLLVGGGDIDPVLYGQEPHSETGHVSPVRDGFEIPLLRAAIDRGLPTLCICRGVQVLNVALGGTLFQDLPSQMGHSVLLGHRQETPKWQPTHEVEVDAGSQVAGIMGTGELKVNSYHHQAVKDLATGLVAVAHAPDGVVEAVEWRDLSQRWLVGVQWHAEAMRDAAPQHRKLFEAHVSAAENHALRRAAA